VGSWTRGNGGRDEVEAKDGGEGGEGLGNMQEGGESINRVEVQK